MPPPTFNPMHGSNITDTTLEFNDAVIDNPPTYEEACLAMDININPPSYAEATGITVATRATSSSLITGTTPLAPLGPRTTRSTTFSPIIARPIRTTTSASESLTSPTTTVARPRPFDPLGPDGPASPLVYNNADPMIMFWIQKAAIEQADFEEWEWMAAWAAYFKPVELRNRFPNPIRGRFMAGRDCIRPRLFFS